MVVPQQVQPVLMMTTQPKYSLPVDEPMGTTATFQNVVQPIYPIIENARVENKVIPKESNDDIYEDDFEEVTPTPLKKKVKIHDIKPPIKKVPKPIKTQ